MKKLFAIVFVLFCFTSLTSFAQNVDPSGLWLVTKAKTATESIEPYHIIDFNPNGKIMALGIIEVGTWKYDKSSNTIIMNSKMDKDFEGVQKIDKLDEHSLVLSKNGTTTYMVRFDTNKIASANKLSNLQGVWNVENPEYGKVFIKFELPHNMTMVIVDENSVETTNGDWVYSPDEKSVIFILFSNEAKGKYKIKLQNDNNAILENSMKKFVLIKNNSKEKLDTLSFKYEDFPEDKDDTELLPWKSLDEMADVLSHVKFLKFRLGHYLNSINTFYYTELLSEVKTDLDNPSVNFKNFTVNGQDTSQYSEKHKDDMMESYNYFFPFEELSPFRVVGKEKLTVPAGTFNCTVVEGLDMDDKYKMWMIENMPGIYAKIIIGKDNFGKTIYTVQELVKIGK